MIFVLFNIEKMDELTTEQAYGSGFFGWHQGYWNVVSTDRLLISPGITFGDYIFGSKRADGVMREPQGYYFHLGPAFKATYVVTNQLWVDGYVHYDIGFKAGKGTGEHVKGYPKPHFLNIGGTINHIPTKLFGAIRVNTLIDRGVNADAGSRLDISAGFYF